MNTLRKSATGVLFLCLPALAQAESLTTTFAGGNGAAGNMFDVTVLAPDDVLITDFDVNIGLANGSGDCESDVEMTVYYKQGSYVGSETTAADWTLLGTATVAPASINTPTPLDVGATLFIPAGQTYALYFDMSDFNSGHDCGVEYTTGANVVADANLSLELGVGKGSPAFTGDTFTPRTWNGTIYYGVLACPATPAMGCVAAQKSALSIKAGKNGKWKWQGPAFDFGDPSTAGTVYSWCLYANGSLVQSDHVPPGVGYKKVIVGQKAIFKGQADSITALKLGVNGAGTKGKAQLSFDASNQPMQAIDEPVVGQLISSDADCLQSTFTPGDSVKNNETQYKAKTK